MLFFKQRPFLGRLSVCIRISNCSGFFVFLTFSLSQSAWFFISSSLISVLDLVHLKPFNYFFFNFNSLLWLPYYSINNNPCSSIARSTTRGNTNSKNQQKKKKTNPSVKKIQTATKFRFDFKGISIGKEKGKNLLPPLFFLNNRNLFCLIVKDSPFQPF